MYCFSSDGTSNTYVIKRFDHSLIIDPSNNYLEITKLLGDNIIDGVLVTHAHFDHLIEISKYVKYPIYIHKDELETFYNDDLNGSKALYHPLNLKKYPFIIKEIKDGDTIKLQDQIIEIIETPGHSKGSVCFKQSNLLFTGDTLFCHDVGRTDLYQGSDFLLRKSIEKIFKSNSRGTIIYPGHGESSTLKDEARNNYYCQQVLNPKHQ